MDAILCADTNLMDIESYLAEMYRILKSGGTFLIISHAAPDRRLRFLEKSLGSMEIELTKIGIILSFTITFFQINLYNLNLFYIPRKARS